MTNLASLVAKVNEILAPTDEQRAYARRYLDQFAPDLIDAFGEEL